MFSNGQIAGPSCRKIQRKFERRFFPVGHIYVCHCHFFINFQPFSVTLVIFFFTKFPFLTLKRGISSRRSLKSRGRKRARHKDGTKDGPFCKVFTDLTDHFQAHLDAEIYTIEPKPHPHCKILFHSSFHRPCFIHLMPRATRQNRFNLVSCFILLRTFFKLRLPV